MLSDGKTEGLSMIPRRGAKRTAVKRQHNSISTKAPAVIGGRLLIILFFLREQVCNTDSEHLREPVKFDIGDCTLLVFDAGD